LLPLFEREPDCLQHAIELLANLMIPKSQHCDSLLGEKLLPCLVAHLAGSIVVPAAIELDRELRSGTIEIEYVWVQRMLSAEFVACEVSVPQMPPQNSLGGSFFLTQ
jgi:hypothetical protein